jgi:Zn-dependent M28 family amino/carboxypeptidase
LNPDKKGVERFVRSSGKASYTAKGRINLFGSIKLFFTSETVADALLSGSGETLANLQKRINDSEKPFSFEIKNRKAEIEMKVLKGNIETKNIVGVIEGSDPVLKDECIVFSAHYDHVGMAQDGEVYNGADDNASGTVALLEIAEAFSQMKRKPKRSIVFAWVTAEEKGLYGSDYYSENPLFPLFKTLTNINLDMVGRSAEKELEKVENENKSLAGPNGIYLISGKQSTELMEIAGKYCKKMNFIPSDALTKPFLTRSDYYNFHKHGIPVLGVTTGLHDDYHQISDETDKIDYLKMRRVAQFCYLVANEVANKAERINVDAPSKK